MNINKYIHRTLCFIFLSSFVNQGNVYGDPIKLYLGIPVLCGMKLGMLYKDNFLPSILIEEDASPLDIANTAELQFDIPITPIGSMHKFSDGLLQTVEIVMENDVPCIDGFKLSPLAHAIDLVPNIVIKLTFIELYVGSLYGYYYFLKDSVNKLRKALQSIGDMMFEIDMIHDDQNEFFNDLESATGCRHPMAQMNVLKRSLRNLCRKTEDLRIELKREFDDFRTYDYGLCSAIIKTIIKCEDNCHALITLHALNNERENIFNKILKKTDWLTNGTFNQKALNSFRRYLRQ